MQTNRDATVCVPREDYVLHKSMEGDIYIEQNEPPGGSATVALLKYHCRHDNPK